MEIYVAVRPVRFDKDYAIGDAIPAEVIDPKHVKRLIESGRIALANESREQSPDNEMAKVLLDVTGALTSLLELLEEVAEITYEGEIPDIFVRAETCMIRMHEGVKFEMNPISNVDDEDPPKNDEEQPTVNHENANDADAHSSSDSPKNDNESNEGLSPTLTEEGYCSKYVS
ncbi:MAG: hypothetical protein FWC89_11275 [Defluviitaleaceae bacterium]|nr:hypothetical protein [Defluviitaleaceae bacterium]